jgi:hypothetical protein
MEFSLIINGLLYLTVCFYFVDYLISPSASELYKIKNSLYIETLFASSWQEGFPRITYSTGEGIHWVLEKITQGFIIYGCIFSSEGSPGVEVGVFYFANHLVFAHIENASLRDAFYRLISILALAFLFLFWMG